MNALCSHTSHGVKDELHRLFLSLFGIDELEASVVYAHAHEGRRNNSSLNAHPRHLWLCEAQGPPHLLPEMQSQNKAAHHHTDPSHHSRRDPHQVTGCQVQLQLPSARCGVSCDMHVTTLGIRITTACDHWVTCTMQKVTVM